MNYRDSSAYRDRENENGVGFRPVIIALRINTYYFVNTRTGGESLCTECGCASNSGRIRRPDGITETENKQAIYNI